MLNINCSVRKTAGYKVVTLHYYFIYRNNAVNSSVFGL